MRIIRRKIYRAFPELDRFNDRQCEEYIRTANSSWLRSAGRLGLVTAVLAVSTVVGIGTAVTLAYGIADRMRLREEDALLIFAACLIPTMFFIGTIGLLTRDIALRVRIRRLVRSCGSCPDCRYTLLGTPLDERNSLRCPECGRQIIADELMGDVGTDAKGVRVYMPRVARVDAHAVERRRKRHRRFFKWSIASVASLVLILGLGYGIVYLLLVIQATQARSERTTVARLPALRATMWPAGVHAESERAWKRYLDLLGEYSAIRVSVRTVAVPDSPGPSVFFDPAVLDPSTAVATYEKQMGPGAYNANRAYVLATLDAADEVGLWKRLHQITDLQSPLRPMPVGELEYFYQVAAHGNGEARTVARVCTARMLRALDREDIDAYVEALETAVAISLVQQRQGLLIDHLVGCAIQTMLCQRVVNDCPVYPGVEWATRTRAAMAPLLDMPSLTLALEVERIGGIDAMQYYFSDVSRVQKGMLGLDSDEMFGSASPGDVGTYRQNRDAINRTYDEWITFVRQVEDGKSGPPPAGITGAAFADSMTPAISRALGSTNSTVSWIRQAMIALECVRFHRENGRWPASMEEIKSVLPLGMPLRDPTTQAPFRLATELERRSVPVPTGLVRSDPAPPAPGMDGNE